MDSLFYFYICDIINSTNSFLYNVVKYFSFQEFSDDELIYDNLSVEDTL